MIASALALSVSAPASAAVLNIQNNILMGATDVNVGGTLYNVSFIDGIFGENITAFTTSESAVAASRALFSQVFIGAFDEISSFTNGCSDSGACQTYTPYQKVGDNVMVSQAINFAPPLEFLDKSTTDVSIPQLRDTTGTQFNIARWSLSTPVVSAVTSAVPEPETYAMFLAGLF